MNVKDQFPILKNLSQADRSYLYFDSASTALKPQQVVDAVSNYYLYSGCNAHRGSSRGSEEASVGIDRTRTRVASFLGAEKHEILFTNSTTGSINLLIRLLNLSRQDTVIGCIHDHHANVIPWWERTQFQTVGLDEHGHMHLDELEKVLKQKRPKLVTITHASNVSGNLMDLNRVVALAKSYGAWVFVDAAQGLTYERIDLNSMEIDFLAFSSHKIFGPTGVGVLYIRNDHHERLMRSDFGGGMVNVFTQQRKSYKRMPFGFEPGTSAIEGIHGFGAALEFKMSLSEEDCKHHLDQLSSYFLKHLKDSPLTLPFPKSEKSLPIFALRPRQGSLDLSNLTRLLSDQYNIVVNDGQHCCHPLYEHYGLNGSLRISLSIVNSTDEIDLLFSYLEELSYLLGA